MKKVFMGFGLGCVVMLAGLAQAQDKPVKAFAMIKGTAEDSDLVGVVKLTETPGGLEVIADLSNVPGPGEHGFHIHEKGSCDEMGKAAGGHFNPDSVDHGMLMKDGHQHAHAGDMGNIMVDQEGHATLKVTLPEVNLTEGKYNVAGLAIILHEKADDFGQPTGNAGGRIACGIIEVEK